MANSKVMRVVKQETKVVSKCPPNDAKRRIEAFIKARKDAKFPTISLNQEHPSTFSEYFLHFGIIVGPKNFETYLGSELGFPIGSPYLETPLPERLAALPMRTVRLEISSDIDIQITTCLLPGSLKVPVAFTGPSEPNDVCTLEDVC